MGDRFRKTLNGFLHRDTPGYLIFFVTPLCDCRCRMCFNRDVIDHAASRNTLCLDEIEKMARNFPHLHHVNFSGGEPFLRPDFAQIPGLFYRHSGTRIFACPTNSSQPDRIVEAVKTICQSCPDAWLRITQSLDGIGADHDAIRGKAGLFERVVELNERLETLRQSQPNLSVGIAMVMSKFNEGKEYDILDFCCEHLAFSDFGALYVRGDTFDAGAREVSSAAYARFVRISRERTADRNTKKGLTGRVFTAINRSATDLLTDSIIHDRFVIPCRAGVNMIVMDDEGTVRPCEILDHYIKTGKAPLETDVLGNIRDFDYDIRALLNSDHVRRITRYIKDSRCYCTFECAMSVNVLYSPQAWPCILKNFWKQ